MHLAFVMQCYRRGIPSCSLQRSAYAQSYDMFLRFMSVADQFSVITSAVLQFFSSHHSHGIIPVPRIQIVIEQNCIQVSHRSRGIYLYAYMILSKASLICLGFWLLLGKVSRCLQNFPLV